MEEPKAVDAAAPIPAAAQHAPLSDESKKWASSQAFFKASAEQAAKPEPASEPEAAPAPEKAAPAPEKGGEEPAAHKWAEDDTRAFKRTGMRDEEIERLSTLVGENPWISGWLDGLKKSQLKQDADFAALKAAKAAEGTREPTPGAQHPLAQEQGDQPGSGQVADLLETLTKRFGEELGDDNATLLRQAFSAQANEVASLRQQLEGLATGLKVEKQVAEIDAMSRSARAQLHAEFSGLADDAKFALVESEMAALRPSEITPEGVMDSMRKAARIVFFDDLMADAKAVASKLDNTRKARLTESAPNGSTASEGKALSDFEISQGIMRMQSAGEPSDRIQAWAKTQHERRRNAANHK